MTSDVERIERQALVAWHEAVSAANLADYDWRLVKIGDALCSVSSSEPSILVNRVLGLGSSAVPTHEQLVEIRQLYRDAGVSRFFLHVVPNVVGPQREKLLTNAGYRRHRGWMKFTRGPGDVREPQTDLSVRRIGAAEAADFAAIAAPAFDMSPKCEPAVAALAGAPGWRLYMTTAGERAAGTGALYVADGVGYLDWAATHPDFRCRGSQTAILSARLHDAFDLGCETIVTMTGEAVPGDPQHSYRNIQKAGFAEAYLRENWIPADS